MKPLRLKPATLLALATALATTAVAIVPGGVRAEEAVTEAVTDALPESPPAPPSAEVGSGTAPAAPPAVEEVEEALPTGYPASRYTAIWENSPFNREVAPPVAQTIESAFAKNLVLEGVVHDDTLGTIAYVRDVANDAPLVVTSQETSAHPYRIVSAEQAHDPKLTKVTLTDGKESGDITFAAVKLTEAISQPAPATPAADARGKSKGAANPRSLLNGGAVPGLRPPGGREPETKEAEDKPVPESVTPALDKMDAEPRRRRVPLPGA